MTTMRQEVLRMRIVPSTGRRGHRLPLLVRQNLECPLRAFVDEATAAGGADCRDDLNSALVAHDGGATLKSAERYTPTGLPHDVLTS